MAGRWEMEAGSTIEHLIKGNHYKLNEYFKRKFNNIVYDNFQLPASIFLTLKNYFLEITFTPINLPLPLSLNSTLVFLETGS